MIEIENATGSEELSLIYSVSMIYHLFSNGIFG